MHVQAFRSRVRYAWCSQSQGQTLSRVGVFLERSCFGHGQFYVAASRVGLPDAIRFAVARNADGEYRTVNEVWREALTG